MDYLSCTVFRSGGVLGAALSLAIVTLGAGILTLPSAFGYAGVIPSLFILSVVAVLTVSSVDFIVHSIDKLGLNSYEEITRELLGRKAEELVRWILIIYNVGSAIGYLVVIADLFEPMQPLISHYLPVLVTSRHTLFAFWLAVILPLSCVPKLSALHLSFVFAIFSTCAIACMIVYRYFVPHTVDGGGMIGHGNRKLGESGGARWWLGTQPLLALPIMMFSFDCQSLVFQVYAGLDDMRRHTMFLVSVISLVVTGSIHAAVGLFGYLSNPYDVRENIINNYNPLTDRLFAVGYILYALPINFAFVLMLFPIRDSLFILWYGYSSASVATHVPRCKDYVRIVDLEEKLEHFTETHPDDSYAEHELQHLLHRKKMQNDVEVIPFRDHVIVSVALSTFCIAVALVTPGVVSVVALLGGVCSSTLCFTCPALYRWKLHQRRISVLHGWMEGITVIGMLCFGVFGGALGTGVVIVEYMF